MKAMDKIQDALEEAESKANEETDRLADRAIFVASAAASGSTSFVALTAAIDEYRAADKRRAAIAALRAIHNKARSLIN